MHPADRYENIIDDSAAFRAACDRPLPTVVRVNTIKATPQEAVTALRAEDVSVDTETWGPNVLTLDTDKPGNTWPYLVGWIHGQEAISQVPPIVLDPQPGDRVLDAAAAPGGKTTQLAALQGSTGSLVANDVNLGRLAALRSNADRLGVTNLAVTCQNARVFSMRPFQFDTFDRVLVDAPCSGEGTIRKKPEVVEEWSADGITGLTEIQTGILRRAIAITSPGGVVVYATCTFAPEENEAVLSAVLETEPCSIEAYDIPLTHAPGVTQWNGESYDPTVARAKRFYPHHNDTGGFFCAKLRVDT